jgi:HAD superfamily hydrolase (TIGR01509 family)
MIDCLIFDFDGVIIDTETPEYVTLQETFSAYGVELDRSLWTRFIGTGLGSFDVYKHLEELVGAPLDLEAIRRRTRQRYLDIVEANPILPGVLDYIRDAKATGLKLGVASSSSRDWVEGHLTRRGLLGHFDCILSKNDVSQVKPDPELYLASVTRLKTRPENALAIEDSVNGITAAKRAGLFCVVVPNDMTRDLSIGHADLRLVALSDIPLRTLLDRALERASKVRQDGATNLSP